MVSGVELLAYNLIVAIEIIYRYLLISLFVVFFSSLWFDRFVFIFSFNIT